MTRKSKVPTLKIGDVYAIDLGREGLAYGVVCTESEMLFFNHEQQIIEDSKNILALPKAFRLIVSQDVIKAKAWNKVESIELPLSLKQPHSYIHKPIGSEVIFIYCDGTSDPAGSKNIDELELFVIWSSADIERRLVEFLNGKPCSTTKALKMQLGL